MTPADLRPLVHAARAAATAAGALLRARPAEVNHKGAIDLVTELDLASERMIREVLFGLVPEIPVQGEEGGGVETGLRWVVDPLDGTTNFVHGYPFYCVSVGLCDGPRPLVGVLFDPLRHELLWAARGLGAALCRENTENLPLRVSETRSLEHALAVTGFPYDRRQNAGFYLRYVQKILERSQGMRRSGSAAMDLATLARGQVDLFWEFGLHAWDTAAGAVIVEEAGGRITTLDGGPWSPEVPQILASNGWVHDEVLRLFAEIGDDR